MSTEKPKTIRCPNCKTEQPPKAICPNCQFDIKAYVLKKRAQQAAAKAQAEGSPAPPAATAAKPTQAPAKPLTLKQARRTAPKPTPGLKPFDFPIDAPSGPEEGAAPKRVITAPMTVEDLFKVSWGIYQRRWLTLLLIMLAGGMLTLVAFAAFPAVGFGLTLLLPQTKGILVLLGWIVGMVAGTVAMGMSTGAYFYSVVDEHMDFKTAFQNGWRRALPFAWIFTLVGFIVYGGFFLLLIPGLIFMVWFFFAPLVLAEEDLRGMSALIKSRELVRGRFWPVLGRLMALWLATVVISLVPILGQLASIVLMPFALIYVYQLYLYCLVQAPDMEDFWVSTGQKAQWILAGAAGYVFVVAVLAFSLGAGSIALLQGLKSAMMGQPAGIEEMAGTIGKITPRSSAPAPAAPQGRTTQDGYVVEPAEYDRLAGTWKGRQISAGSGTWTFKFLPGYLAEITMPDGAYNKAQVAIFMDKGQKNDDGSIQVPPGAGMLDLKITESTYPVYVDNISLGVYSFTFERLTLCSARPGLNVRPTSWEPTGDVECFDLVKQQETPAPGSQPGAPESASQEVSGSMFITVNDAEEQYILKSGFMSDTRLKDPKKATVQFQMPGTEGSNGRRIEIEIDSTRIGRHAVDGAAVEESFMGPDKIPTGIMTPHGAAAKVKFIEEGGQVFFPVGICIIDVYTPYTGQPDSVFSGQLDECTFQSAGINKQVKYAQFTVRGAQAEY